MTPPGGREMAGNGYWVDDYSDFRPKSDRQGHWGSGQTGFNISLSGSIYLSDNRPTEGRGGLLHHPCHRDLITGQGDDETIWAGIYSWSREVTIWLYPSTEGAVMRREEMRKGLASLIGVHKITEKTPVKSNTERGTLFLLGEANGKGSRIHP